MIGLLFCIDYASFVGMMSLWLDLLSWLISVIGEVWCCCSLTSVHLFPLWFINRPKLKGNSTDYTSKPVYRFWKVLLLMLEKVL